MLSKTAPIYISSVISDTAHISKLNIQFKDNVKVQNKRPQDKALWYVNCFDLKTIEFQETQKKTLTFPANCLKKI